MGKVKKRNPTKLIIGLIFKEEVFFEKVKTILKKRFGTIDFQSQTLPFKYTDYYEKEFGTGLKRKFISFKKLIYPQSIAKIKIFTNKIEDKFLLKKTVRLINIDPGYLELGKLVLATTKDHKHRIYLDKGIYAEVTLFYEDKSFKPWTWTYPDYASNEYLEIFDNIRNIYAQQIKNELP